MKCNKAFRNSMAKNRFKEVSRFPNFTENENFLLVISVHNCEMFFGACQNCKVPLHVWIVSSQIIQNCHLPFSQTQPTIFTFVSFAYWPFVIINIYLLLILCAIIVYEGK